MSDSSSISNNDGNIDDTSMNDEDDSSSQMRVPPFVTGQRVFCTDESSADASTYYEAIIRKTSWTGSHWNFLVHYLGWNARWDKWLDESLLQADTEETRAKVQAQQEESTNKRKREEQEAASAATTTTTSVSSARKKRVVDRGPSYADYCELPFTLKTILVDDRERIMRSYMVTDSCDDAPPRLVHDLPARVTVKQVLHHFCKVQKKQFDDDEAKQKEAEQKARAFTQELAALFDESLEKCLLYPPERPQYEHFMQQANKQRPCEVYSCEFLLRFFVRLPILLEQAPSQHKKKQVGKQLADLIVLLQKNRQACFKARYRKVQPEEMTEWEKQGMANSVGGATHAIAMDE